MDNPKTKLKIYFKAIHADNLAKAEYKDKPNEAAAAALAKVREMPEALGFRISFYKDKGVVRGIKVRPLETDGGNDVKEEAVPEEVRESDAGDGVPDVHESSGGDSDPPDAGRGSAPIDDGAVERGEDGPKPQLDPAPVVSAGGNDEEMAERRPKRRTVPKPKPEPEPVEEDEEEEAPDMEITMEEIHRTAVGMLNSPDAPRTKEDWAKMVKEFTAVTKKNPEMEYLRVAVELARDMWTEAQKEQKPTIPAKRREPGPVPSRTPKAPKPVKPAKIKNPRPRQARYTFGSIIPPKFEEEEKATSQVTDPKERKKLFRELKFRID